MIDAKKKAWVVELSHYGEGISLFEHIFNDGWDSALKEAEGRVNAVLFGEISDTIRHKALKRLRGGKE